MHPETNQFVCVWENLCVLAATVGISPVRVNKQRTPFRHAWHLKNFTLYKALELWMWGQNCPSLSQVWTYTITMSVMTHDGVRQKPKMYFEGGWGLVHCSFCWVWKLIQHWLLHTEPPDSPGLWSYTSAVQLIKASDRIWFAKILQMEIRLSIWFLLNVLFFFPLCLCYHSQRKQIN